MTAAEVGYRASMFILVFGIAAKLDVLWPWLAAAVLFQGLVLVVSIREGLDA